MGFFRRQGKYVIPTFQSIVKEMLKEGMVLCGLLVLRMLGDVSSFFMEFLLEEIDSMSQRLNQRGRLNRALRGSKEFSGIRNLEHPEEGWNGGKKRRTQPKKGR